MSVNREAEIDSCLAYTVLRSPDSWIGGQSTVHLQAFLCGALTRRDYVASPLPDWRISGILDDPKFYLAFVEATGRPTLSIRWATALAMTHHSYAEGFAKLKDEALEWHRKNGITEDQLGILKSPGRLAGEDPQAFWNSLAEKPAMHFGSNSGEVPPFTESRV